MGAGNGALCRWAAWNSGCVKGAVPGVWYSIKQWRMLGGKREPCRLVPAPPEVLAQAGSGLHHLPKSPSRAAEPMEWDRAVAAEAGGTVLS